MLRTFAIFVVVVIGLIIAYTTLIGGRSVPTGDAVSAIAEGATVVDVRTADEFAAGHIAGALHADVLDAQFEQRMAALDPSEPVYLYCASGVRSGRAAAVLEGMGFHYVVNAGGFDKLVSEGATVER